MNIKRNINAFTIVELVVTITILAILGTIAFISLQGYSQSARDAVRLSDLGVIKSGFEMGHIHSNRYPNPDSSTNIVLSGAIVWTQGVFGKGATAQLNEITSDIVDPLYKNYYTYSVTKNQNEYELGAVLEDDALSSLQLINQSYADNGMKSYIIGKYNGVGVKTGTGGVDYIVAVPGIIANNISNPSLSNILLQRKLSYFGESCLPHSYGITGTCGTYVNWGNVLAFQGNFQALSRSGALRVALSKGIQNAYIGSDIANSNLIYGFTTTTILPSNPSADAIVLADDTYTNIFKGEIIDTGDTSYGGAYASYNSTFLAGNEYTTSWTSNACSGSVTIRPKSPGDEATMTTIPSNTVYVLSAGTYTLSSQIYMNNCSAIIGDGEVILTSDRKLDNGMVTVENRSNIIIDNLIIDGENYSGGTHAKNVHGIDTNATSSTITNILAYNNEYGLNIDNSSNVIVKNYTSFNNSITGVYIDDSNGSILEDIRTFNNSFDGLNVNDSDRNTFQNVLSYNNTRYGIVFTTGSDNNAVNNSATFNNQYWGLRINSGTNNFINNTLAYKNREYEFVISTANNHLNAVQAYGAASSQGIFAVAGNYRYGNVKNPVPVNNLATSTTYVPPFTTGSLTSLAEGSPLTDPYVIKPSTTGWNVNSEEKQSVTFDGTETYAFGANIPTQVRPVRYNSTTSLFELYGVDGSDYDSGKKIGE